MLTNIIELIEPIIHEDFMLNLTNNEELNYEPENEDIYANALNSNGTYLDDIKKFIKINSNKLLVFHIKDFFSNGLQSISSSIISSSAIFSFSLFNFGFLPLFYLYY